MGDGVRILTPVQILQEIPIGGVGCPITDRLVSYCLENALLVSLEDPKTIDDLREELDFPDHRLYLTAEIQSKKTTEPD